MYISSVFVIDVLKVKVNRLLMQREENSITSKSLAWTVNCPCD